MKRMDFVIKKVYHSVSKEFKIAFLSVLIFGLIAHLYMFTNKLPNYDDLVSINGFGTTFRTGRWFLWVVGAIAYHLEFVYSLPFINGMLTLILLGISAGLIVDLLKISSIIGNVLIGAALVVYPSWTATFFFLFTAHFYALAVFIAVVSVYIIVKHPKWWVLSIVLLACSLGIYQAYFPFVATLYIVVLLLMCYEEDSYLDILKKSLFYLAHLVGAFILYYLIMKITLMVTGQELASYKGVNDLGRFDFNRIPEIFNNILMDYLGIFTNNNLELSYNFVTKGMYFTLFIITFILFVTHAIKIIKNKEYMKAITWFVLICAYLIAINGIFIIVDEGEYLLMYFSYVFTMILPLCLIDRRAKQKKDVFILETISIVALLCGIGSYCHFSNAQYLSMQLSYEQATHYGTTLITQIKSIEGYDETLPVVFVGDTFEDQSLYRNEIMGAFSSTARNNVLVDAYSFESLLKYYCGFNTTNITLDEEQIAKTESMPIYPKKDSIQIIENIIVVKIGNTVNE